MGADRRTSAFAAVRRWFGRQRWEEFALPTLLLVIVGVLATMWTLDAAPGSFVSPDLPAPTGPTQTEEAGQAPEPSTDETSLPGASSAPPTTGMQSVDPTAIPTIPDCIAPRRFTVLTFNIHGGRTPHGVDLAAVANEIRRADADIVLLQEVDQNLGRTGFRDEPAVVGKALGMSVYFHAQVRSNAILTRFPVTSWSSTKLPLASGHEERRVVHASVLVDGQSVQVFDTHLDNSSASLRRAQILAVKRVMERYADQPLVLGGDLNAAPGGAVLQIARSYLFDPWPEVGEGAGYTVPAGNPRTRIDYVLHNSWLTPRRAQVLPSAASDHRGVRLVFDLWGTPNCGD